MKKYVEVLQKDCYKMWMQVLEAVFVITYYGDIESS